MLRYEIGFASNNKYSVRVMNYLGRTNCPCVRNCGKTIERISRITLPEIYETMHDAQIACNLYNSDLEIVKGIMANTLGEGIFVKP